MRKRSMSVYVAKDDDRLSKKFEGVASDNDAHFDSEDETKDDEVLSGEWTKADYESLVAQLKETLPKKDHRKWKTSLQAVNWEQIKIRQHTPQEVEKVAKQLIGKIRSFRTFGEILEEVPDVVTKLLSAERPKPPLTAYSLFVKEMLPQLREEHKDMKVQQIFKIVPKLFQELSTKKRRRYEDESARMKEEYQANLSKFYQDHPDLTPRKIRKEPLKTPFQLFYRSRRATSDNISCQQVRKEWEALPLKKKVKFIRASFEAQADTDSKLLNKKELIMLDQSLGKPEFVGRNVYEFFRRKMRSQYAAANGNEREHKIRMDYKKLDAQEQSQLKEEFQKARTAFVFQYQEYIKKLPKDKQQAEIDFLKTISDKTTKKQKTEKKTPQKAALKELHSAGSADEDTPVAESTTINKKLTTGKKSKTEPKFDDSAEESELSDHRTPLKKQPKISIATAPPPPSTSKAPGLLSVSKSEPPASSASSSDEEEDGDKDEEEYVPTKHQVSMSRKSVPASPSKNGSARKVSDTKKRPSPEDVKPEVEVKKPKKTSAKVVKPIKQEEEPEALPPPAIKGTKAAKTKEIPAKTLKEPEKPPKKRVHSLHVPQKLRYVTPHSL
ncbi:nucleolar protein dao-5-like isoform X2 [Ochlerotatus camptorhynchus]|uniref:nucleolar protein dao-5-like isoform X2 n=1 Tax=Ochlerotatus camptorhynchus TaxID=644619 RepID=UPI0031DE55EE